MRALLKWSALGAVVVLAALQWDLNFSEWPTDDFELREMALRDIEEQIVKGEMPLDSYLLLHGNARLSEADRETLLEWARSGY